MAIFSIPVLTYLKYAPLRYSKITIFAHTCRFLIQALSWLLVWRFDRVRFFPREKIARNAIVRRISRLNGSETGVSVTVFFLCIGGCCSSRKGTLQRGCAGRVRRATKLPARSVLGKRRAPGEGKDWVWKSSL
ncbi:hypothetical protein ECB98_11550 [Brucellaceae bacterium VT-16-1752]|nr:hypothetical protein ECB98_11550 [Brucellaceae bacterium VT-16-1752]TNV17636.1 hypothetical protein FIC94_05510 [[Ochrobactrum] teleogrylli]